MAKSAGDSSDVVMVDDRTEIEKAESFAGNSLEKVPTVELDKGRVLSLIEKKNMVICGMENCNVKILRGNFEDLLHHGTRVGFIRCIKCKGLFKFLNSRNGTRALSRHLAERCGFKGLLVSDTHHPLHPDIPQPLDIFMDDSIGAFGGPILSLSRGSSGSASPGGAGASSIKESLASLSSPPQKQMKIEVGFAALNWKVPPNLKAQMQRSLASFVTRDDHAFSAVEGSGLKDVIRTAIKMQHRARNRKLTPEMVLEGCKRKAITDVCHRMATEEYPALMKKLVSECDLVGLTADLWLEKYTQTSYFGITLHFWIPGAVELCVLILHVEKFAFGVKTANNVAKTFSKAVEGIQLSLSKVVTVTDNGSNVIAAVKQMKVNAGLRDWLRCADHCINICLTIAFRKAEEAHAALLAAKGDGLDSDHSDEEDEREELRIEVGGVLKTMREVVTHFRRHALQNELRTTLKKCQDTRWNSQLTMIESFRGQVEKISELLRGSNLSLSKAGITEEVVGDLTKFLKPFDLATKTLEGDKQPTLHLVLPCYEKLLRHCCSYEADKLCGKMARDIKELLPKKFPMDRLHLAAALLNVGKRNLKFLQEEILVTDSREKKVFNALPTVDSCVDALVHEMKIIVPPEPNPEPTITAERKAKRQKMSNAFLSDDSESEPDDSENDGTLSGTEPELEEIKRYQQRKFPKEELSNSVMAFWNNHGQEFPRLQKVAYCLLSIPASSSPSERAFSQAGWDLNERRSRMTPEHLDSLLCVKSGFESGLLNIIPTKSMNALNASVSPEDD